MSGTSDILLWIFSFGALVTAFFVLGGRRIYPALGWVILFFWLQIAGDLIAAALAGQPLAADTFGEFRGRAIFFSLAAMLAMAVGMRTGIAFGKTSFGEAAPGSADLASTSDHAVSLRRALTCYFLTLIFLQALDALARFVPVIAQPLLALGLIRYVFIYLVAATVFEMRRGYAWLLLLVVVEIGSGMMSYFSSYKEAVFVILLAMVASRRPMNLSRYAMGVIGLLVLLWISLVWTGIKGEYRSSVFWRPVNEKVAWLSKRYFADNIDYNRSAVMLFRRIGYTKFYTMVLVAGAEKALPQHQNFYGNAIMHIATPRVFFPDKAALNDSILTSRLLGIPIDANTSIGVGYVAQAHVDFGFPGLLAPLFGIGGMLGFAAQYFMTRRRPLIIRTAFTTAVVFMAFPFAANIDKALGGFLMGALVMGLALRYGYPHLANWLAGNDPEPSGIARRRLEVAPR